MNPFDTAAHAGHAHPINPQPVPGRESFLRRLVSRGSRVVVEKPGGTNKPPHEAGDETIMHAPCL